MRAHRFAMSRSSANTPDIRQVFVSRVHQIIQRGFDRLNPGGYQKAKEEVITGDLALEIEKEFDDPESRLAPWTRLFSIHEDSPVGGGTRKGRQRRRIDIRIDSLEIVPRARFRFEAKRLGRRNPAKKYVGDEGLGRFISGRYAFDEDDAGMLGYVQSKSPAEWAPQIGASFVDSLDVFPDRPDSKWEPAPFPGGPGYTYRSRHTRVSVGRPIDIYHSLLGFQ